MQRFREHKERRTRSSGFYTKATQILNDYTFRKYGTEFVSILDGDVLRFVRFERAVGNRNIIAVWGKESLNASPQKLLELSKRVVRDHKGRVVKSPEMFEAIDELFEKAKDSFWAKHWPQVLGRYFPSDLVYKD